ncbi:MAG: hypothetical protein KAJ37_02875 [Candidatus Krumholzibacteria bacterium]|nr:hypothetical protein [Candidatus Krumholzibacteria bacterium]
MISPILSSFLEEQEIEAARLASVSDLVDVEPIGRRPYQKYIIHFACRTLASIGGDIAEVESAGVGFLFKSDYWQRANTFEMVRLLWPREIFLPNANSPFFCPGNVAPGVSLVDYIYQSYEVLSGQKVQMREDDALNGAACAWARRHPSRFPIDDRPLTGRRLAYRIKDARDTEEKR